MQYAMNVDEVIALVPDKLLNTLTSEIGVDRSVKKLNGKVTFQLFLYALLSGTRVSLRILEAIFNSEKFQRLFNIESKKIKHSGIGMRLSRINYRYFENIFRYLVESRQVNTIFFSRQKIHVRKIDSTLVTLSSKLVTWSMKDNGKAAVKYTLEMSQGIPVDIRLFKDAHYVAEDNALPELICKKPSKTSLNIAIFDRGIQKRNTFIALVKSRIHFISRLTRHHYRVAQSLPLPQKDTPTLELLSDQIIQFKNGRQTFDEKFRLVVGKNKKTQELISFITNVDFLEAHEITELYKSRWEIETFFKFLKQELHLSHLISRTENGIKVVMYLTMIAAILLTIYKKTNHIIGWTSAKIKFLDELETSLMYHWHQEITSVFNSSSGLISAQVRDG